MPTKETKYRQTNFARAVAKNREDILTGQVLALDPASGSGSQTGYAVYVKGKLKRSGLLKVPPKDTLGKRLAKLTGLSKKFDKVTVVVVERLRGRRVHAHLHWATGALLAGVACDVCIEVPIPSWKAVAKETDGYEKSDEADAVAIGQAVIDLAHSLEPPRSSAKVKRRAATNKPRTKRANRVRGTKRVDRGRTKKRR